MSKLEKIDYKELGKQDNQSKRIEEQQKKFSLVAYWSTADKKVKLEMVIFLIIILAFITTFIIYFIQRIQKAPEPFYEIEEGAMYMDEETF